jgi:DNA-binding HxlR family transcriptional regulator
MTGAARYHTQRRQRNENKILTALSTGSQRFTALLNLTGLSRPVLSNHLKRLQREGKVTRRTSPDAWPRYHLTTHALQHPDVQRHLFTLLSTHIFNDVYDATQDGMWNDAKFIQHFGAKIGLLAQLTLYLGLQIGRNDPAEGAKWIHEAFANAIHRFAWRRCLSRQLLGGSPPLTQSVTLPASPLPMIRDDLVTLPDALTPETTEQILRHFPYLQLTPERLARYRDALHTQFPDEMHRLDTIFQYLQLDQEVNTARPENT